MDEKKKKKRKGEFKAKKPEVIQTKRPSKKEKVTEVKIVSQVWFS